jgi:HNH endonuclease
VIRLTKGAKPDILVRLAAKWTAELLKRIADGDKPSDYLRTRYREKEIKNALIVETHCKCAYCESKVLHITFGDVEHVIPKSARPDLSFEWTNLTLACDVCNTNKGQFIGDHDRIVDPYNAEPLDHFVILGPIILAKLGDGDGKITETELELNRPPLVERRTERLESLRQLMENIHVTSDEGVRDTLRRDIETRELAAQTEYAAFGRAFYGAMKDKS